MGNIRFTIKDEVENLLSDAIEVNIAVALCSNYAINALQNVQKNCKLRIVTGVDLPTPLEALRTLKNRYKKKARIYTESFFHPKVYIFRLKNKELVAYIGSGNFTEGGLLNNIEVFYKIEDQDECNNISGWFENVFNKSLCITDNFLIEYKEYSKKWIKEENKRKFEIKCLLNEANEKKRLFDSLKVKLKEIREGKEYEEICKSLLGFAMKIAQKSRARENSNPLCAGCLMPGSSRMYAGCRNRPSRLILIKTMRSRHFLLTAESASEKFESVLRKIPSVYRGQNTCIIITGRSFHIRHRKTKSCRGKIS